MSRALLYAVFITFIVSQLTSAAPIVYYHDELHLGQCTGVLLVDDDVVKPAAPFTTRKLTYTWKGYDEYSLTCVNVSNRLANADKGSVRLLRGGIGESEMVLELTSQNGKELNFHVQLYADFRGNYY
ncbi:uncharacterized protein LOC108903998 [Anoplophora glabripennis]|uniref:uncharacterized protein LOC108903998 n=1 Tax=Anoplophora glabripennis TaxID=217634 RepID=UPI0008753FB4|nr:uncharacterized protein LOC108903998 [Anoplophora glabripennis]